jgi:hypothetical protein
MASSVTVWTPAAQAEDSPAGGSPIDVQVSGEGTSVPGIRVSLAPDKGGMPEAWSMADTPPIATIETDGTGHAIFAAVPPGRYIVTTGCGIPGNWIAGNYATRLETLPGRPASVTLTLRRGGMVRGKALRGNQPASTASVQADSPDALMSTCGMMMPTLVDSANGGFEVSKIPLHATTWVKGALPIGAGKIEVWKDVHLDSPDTVDVTLQFPSIPPSERGTLLINLKPDGTTKPDPGSADLLQVKTDGSWRYQATVQIVPGVVTVRNLPAGPYQIRANAAPGSAHWWTTPIDSVTVIAGKSTPYVVPVKIRS